MGDLIDMLPSDAPVADYNRFVDSTDAHHSTADVGEAIDIVLVGPELPEQMTRIALYADGMGSESVEPTTAEGTQPLALGRTRTDTTRRTATHVLRFYGEGTDRPLWRCSCGAVSAETSHEDATWSAQMHLNEVYATADDEV